ncbi:hypothetical protein [Terrarubrum flagellatum]|uniref:hypothetical protein n=1 Tax=Terrirubrum flagellatum TaxID=2895980 RepID=UPI0031451BAD
MVPPGEGGPTPRLKQDGLVGPKTRSAIKQFQTRQFGSGDSLIEPNKRTEKRLLEMETSSAVYPLVNIGAAQKQATAWLTLTAQRFLNGIDSSGYGTDAGLTDVGLNETLRGIFRLKLRKQRASETSEETQEARLVAQVRANFAAAAQLVNKDVRVLEIKYADMYSDLGDPNLHKSQPVRPAPTVMFATYKFADWDATCGYGLGPMTRAGVYLQGVFLAVDYNNTTPLTADELYIKVGASMPGFMPSLAVHDSSRYSWICQALSGGDGPMAKFYHVPSVSTGWTDVPELP